MKNIKKSFVLYAYTADTTLYLASDIYPTVDATERCEYIHFIKMVSRFDLGSYEYDVYFKDVYKQKQVRTKVILEYKRPFLTVAFKDVDLDKDTVLEFEIKDNEHTLYKGTAIYTDRDLQVFNFTDLKQVKYNNEQTIENTTQFKECKKL